MKRESMIPGQASSVVCMLLASLFVVSGCCTPEPSGFDPSDGFAGAIKPADISYTELAERYNKAVQPLGQLWARTDVDMEWFEVDEDGDRDYRSESGDGKFIMRRPYDTALTVEKLGKIYLWAGSNREQYFLIDRIADTETAYLGAFSKLGQPGTRRFPLPIRPDTVPILMGLLPLPAAENLATPATVDLYNNQYLVEVRDAGLRMLVDRETFRPTRVDMTDRSGYSILTAKLLGKFNVEHKAKAESDRPIICEKVEVYVSGYESRVTVEITRATTRHKGLRDQTFDFDLLRNAFNIEKVVPLDR